MWIVYVELVNFSNVTFQAHDLLLKVMFYQKASSHHDV